jgi:hypothetical protein
MPPLSRARPRQPGPATGPIAAGELGCGPGRQRLPDDPEALDILRRFEEEILLPRCHAHVCAVLDSAGLLSIGSRQQSRLAEAVRSAVVADPEIAEQLPLASERRPGYDEIFEHERQQVGAT